MFALSRESLGDEAVHVAEEGLSLWVWHEGEEAARENNLSTKLPMSPFCCTVVFQSTFS